MIKKYISKIILALFCGCTLLSVSASASDLLPAVAGDAATAAEVESMSDGQRWQDDHYRGHWGGVDPDDFNENWGDWYGSFDYDPGWEFWEDADRGHRSMGGRHRYNFGVPPRDFDRIRNGDDGGDDHEGRGEDRGEHEGDREGER